MEDKSTKITTVRDLGCNTKGAIMNIKAGMIVGISMLSVPLLAASAIEPRGPTILLSGPAGDQEVKSPMTY
jgi:hypothetical protein